MLSARELSDQVEIGQLLQRYAQALDSREFARLDAIFAADAEVEYRLGERVTLGSWRENRDMFTRFLDVFAYTSHLISPPIVELAGDEARAESRLIAAHGWERVSGGRGTWLVFGLYRDTLVRRPEGWRIRVRRFDGLGEQGDLPARNELKRFAPGG